MGRLEHDLVRPILKMFDEVIPKLTKGMAEGQVRYARHLEDAAEAFERTDKSHISPISEGRAAALHHGGHTITAVRADGSVTTDTRDSAHSVSAHTVKAAMAAEPQLTGLVSGLANKHGGKMAGLDFKLKSEESLTRKFQEGVDAGKGTAPQVGADMFDVNRYTTVYPEAQYACGAQATLDTMRAQGLKLNVKKYWNVDTNPYQGLNVQATTAAGQKFELQFHSGTSLSVKEGRNAQRLRAATCRAGRHKMGRVRQAGVCRIRQDPRPARYQLGQVNASGANARACASVTSSTKSSWPASQSTIDGVGRHTPAMNASSAVFVRRSSAFGW